jgi:hypothetical protein
MSEKNNFRKCEKYEERILNLCTQLKYDEALHLCTEGIDIFEVLYSKEHVTALTLQLHKIAILSSLNEHIKSVELLKDFESLYKQQIRSYLDLRIGYHFCKAALEKARNSLDEAEKQYLKVRQLQKSQEISKIFIGIQTNVNLAEIYQQKNELNKAVGFIEDAIGLLENKAMNKRFFGSRTFKFASVSICALHKFIANSRLQTGDFDLAEQYYEKAVSTCKEAKLSKDIHIDLIVDSAKVKIIAGKMDAAKKMLQQAKDIANPGFPLIYSIAYYEALILYKGGDSYQALKILLEIYESIFPKLSKEYYEKLELELISKIIIIYSEVGDNSKSLFFLKIINKELNKTFSKSLRSLTDHDRYHLINSLSKVLQNIYKLTEKYSTLSLSHKEELFNFRLLMKSAFEYQELCVLENGSLFRKNLNEKSIIVDILKVPKSDEVNDLSIYYAFLIDVDIRIVFLGDQNHIEGDNYNKYLSNIKRKATDIISYNNYWRQVDEHILDKTNIHLTTDGHYNYINIDNFLTPNGDYYYEGKTVSVFNNYFCNSGSTDSVNNELCIFGNPNFESVRAKKYYRPLEYIPLELDHALNKLPYSESEGKSISELLVNSGYSSSQYYGESATVKNIFRVNNPKVLHIATHSFNFPKLSTLNSLSEWEFLSGLMMANSIFNKNGKKLYNNSGMLYSQNIKRIKLKNTKLAVLSACQSGGGIILDTGGIIGIQKAMFIAGVENLLVALWEIEDKVTQEFMIAFYSEWVKKEDIDISFTVAKTYIKEKYIHPFYWAGFRVIHNSLKTTLGNENA